jgi:hypothetical protein
MDRGGPYLRIQASKSKLFYDRRSFDQCVLVWGHHLETATNFSSSSMEILLRHLRFFTLGCPLWREDGSLIFIAVTPQAEPHKTHNHTLLHRLRFMSPYLCPSGTGWPSYALRHWVSFSSPPKTRRGCGGGILFATTRWHTDTNTSTRRDIETERSTSHLLK